MGAVTSPAASGLPWPAAGDALFKDDEPDWKNNACFYFGISDETRIDGFKLAADMLVAAIVSSPVDQDVLVYPIVFNYRQYLELRLKALRVYGFDLYEWPITGALNHKLLPVWMDCKRVIAAHFPREDPAGTVALETLIKEFEKGRSRRVHVPLRDQQAGRSERADLDAERQCSPPAGHDGQDRHLP